MSGSGSTVAVSVKPVGSGTVELMPINGYPSLLDGAAADALLGYSGSRSAAQPFALARARPPLQP
jgi:hypothetical protein